MAASPRFSIKSRHVALLSILLILIVILLLRGKQLSVAYYLRGARVALQNRQEEAALEQLHQAEKIESSSAETQFLLARTHRRLGQLELAAKHLRRAESLGLSPTLARCEKWLALAQTGQLAQAEPHLKELATGDRANLPDICEAFVNGYLLNYRIAEAMNMLDAWQADFPDDSQPHYCRAKVWRHLGLLNKAIPEYEKSLELAPQRLDVRLDLAEVLAGQHRYEEAASHYQTCLKEDPANTRGQLGWARCLLAQGEDESPREILTQLLIDDPNNFAALLELGRLDLSLGNAKQAMPALQRAVELRPQSPAARYELAQAMQAAGDIEGARQHFEYAAAANQALEQAQQKMQVVQEQPKQVELRYDIGATLLRYGSETEGIAWLGSVLELVPDHAPTLQTLSTYHAQQGNEALARHYRRLAGAAE